VFKMAVLSESAADAVLRRHIQCLSPLGPGHLAVGRRLCAVAVERPRFGGIEPLSFEAPTVSLIALRRRESVGRSTFNEAI